MFCDKEQEREREGLHDSSETCCGSGGGTVKNRGSEAGGGGTRLEMSLSSLETKLEARLREFEHVQRRDRAYTGQRMLNTELPGRRRRFSDVGTE